MEHGAAPGYHPTDGDHPEHRPELNSAERSVRERRASGTLGTTRRPGCGGAPPTRASGSRSGQQSPFGRRGDTRPLPVGPGDAGAGAGFGETLSVSGPKHWTDFQSAGKSSERAQSVRAHVT